MGFLGFDSPTSGNTGCFGSTENYHGSSCFSHACYVPGAAMRILPMSSGSTQDVCTCLPFNLLCFPLDIHISRSRLRSSHQRPHLTIPSKLGPQVLFIFLPGCISNLHYTNHISYYVILSINSGIFACLGFYNKTTIDWGP